MNLETLYYVVMSALIAGLIYNIIQLVRIQVACKQYDELFYAWSAYVSDSFKNCVRPKVGFCDLMSYSRVLRDITVWRMDQMLPKEKFELIKPYLKK